MVRAAVSATPRQAARQKKKRMVVRLLSAPVGHVGHAAVGQELDRPPLLVK